MNGRQRLQRAMDRETPDRVPLMCQLSIGHMLLQLRCSPSEFWLDAMTYADGLVALREIYDFDGILVSLHGHDPEWQSQVASIKKSQDGEELAWRNGVRMVFPADDLPLPVEGGEKTTPSLGDLKVSKLPSMLKYIPVSQGVHFKIHPEHTFDVFRILRKKIGSSYSLHGEVTSPFDYYLDLVGHQEGLIGLIDHPAAAKKILGYFTTLVRPLAEEMCREGVDAIKISSPFAGAGFISPGFYREFVLPYEREIALAIRSKGVHAYTHTCGAISDRLELMFLAGVSGIECLDPPPLGDVELEEAMTRIDRRGFVKGNIDSVSTLLLGTPKTILSDARRRLRVGKEYGGFILSTACSVAPGVTRENLTLLREAVDQWG